MMTVVRVDSSTNFARVIDKPSSSYRCPKLTTVFSSRSHRDTDVIVIESSYLEHAEDSSSDGGYRDMSDSSNEETFTSPELVHESSPTKPPSTTSDQEKSKRAENTTSYGCKGRVRFTHDPPQIFHYEQILYDEDELPRSSCESSCQIEDEEYDLDDVSFDHTKTLREIAIELGCQRGVAYADRDAWDSFSNGNFDL